MNIEELLSLRAPWIMNWHAQVRRCGSCEAGAKVITSNIFILHHKFCSTTTVPYIYVTSSISIYALCAFVHFTFSTWKSGLCSLYHREIFMQGQFIDVRRSRFAPLINSSLFYSVHFLVQLKCFWTVKHGNIFWHQYCIFSTEEAGYFTISQLVHQIAK